MFTKAGVRLGKRLTQKLTKVKNKTKNIFPTLPYVHVRQGFVLARATADKSAAHYSTMGHFLALRRAALFINALTGAVVWRGQKEF
jgi:hypothetical protein